MEKSNRSRVPWSIGPSLKAKTEEVGIDLDTFIDRIENDITSGEMAKEFGVTTETIENLKEHFFSRGLDSIMGQN